MFNAELQTSSSRRSKWSADQILSGQACLARGCTRSEKTKWSWDHNWHTDVGWILGLLYCKDVIPNSVYTKHNKYQLLNAEMALCIPACLVANGAKKFERTWVWHVLSATYRGEKKRSSLRATLPCTTYLVYVFAMLETLFMTWAISMFFRGGHCIDEMYVL